MTYLTKRNCRTAIYCNSEHVPSLVTVTVFVRYSAINFWENVVWKIGMITNGSVCYMVPMLKQDFFFLAELHKWQTAYLLSVMVELEFDKFQACHKFTQPKYKCKNVTCPSLIIHNKNSDKYSTPHFCCCCVRNLQKIKHLHSE